MAEFATFFLGLLLGPQPVELKAGQEVTTVENAFESRPVSAPRGETRKMLRDLGSRLAPCARRTPAAAPG